MLALTRKSGEAIVLILEDGRHVTFRVEQKGKAIKVGIDAAKTIQIKRQELIERETA